MKIYFAGSIRGGRDDRGLYRELITFISGFGKVLTEHIGEKTLSEMGEEFISDKEIFKRDMNWLMESDLVIAEVTTPSLGVGYEIACAESLGKKILCLFRKNEGKRLSAMLTGNTYVSVGEYSRIEEAKEIIRDFLNN
jgi:2'-deoxynucleoside 5'-phosphate N-hydrolase